MTRLSILIGAFFAAIATGTITLAATPSNPAPDADATPWSAGPYAYDGSGNIYSIGTDQYRYDPYGRLVTSNVSGTKQSFTYDRYGNIVSVATTPQGGSQTTLSLQPEASNNRLPQNGTDVNASYDASGRTLSVRHMTGVLNATFTYDALDSVVASSEPTPRIHLYTANDERIATLGISGTGTAGSDWTLRDASGKVLRRMKRSANGAWTWVEDYVYLNGQLVASDVATPERTLHHHPDHLGSPRLITNHMGARVALHTYYAFGREITDTNQDAEPLKYTGHERDSPELDYMHARYYLPGWGRFLSVDPVLDVERALFEPQRWNRYSYVENNPLTRLDPDGRQSLSGAEWVMARRTMTDEQFVQSTQASGRGAVAGLTLAVLLRAGPKVYRAAAPYVVSWALALAPRAPQIIEMLAPPGMNLRTIGAADRGILREEIVANSIGGVVSGQALKTAIGSTDIDVIGKAGEFIEVGGASKGWTAATLSSFGNQLEKLKRGAAAAGVAAQAYLEEGTPQTVIDMARKKLGAENVFIYRIIEK